MAWTGFKRGPKSRFKDIEFWAEGGVVCFENRNDGDFKCLTRVEAAARAIALNEELKYMDYYPNERDELCRCVVSLSETVKEAKRQGDPTDPEVRKQRIRDSRKVSLLTSRSQTAPNPPAMPGYFGASGASLVSSDRFRRLRF